jgi:hypothetical protein
MANSFARTPLSSIANRIFSWFGSATSSNGSVKDLSNENEIRSFILRAQPSYLLMEGVHLGDGAEGEVTVGKHDGQ